jgi:hypothetical protein
MVASKPVPCTDNTLDEPVATKGPIACPETEPVNEPVTCANAPIVFRGDTPNLPMLIVSSEKISIKGKPEIVFTENKEPDSPSVTENN